jgi:hypothetical protein
MNNRPMLQQTRAEVAAILENAKKACQATDVEEDEEIPIKEELKKIVWFLTPKQAAQYLKVV